MAPPVLACAFAAALTVLACYVPQPRDSTPERQLEWVSARRPSASTSPNLPNTPTSACLTDSGEAIRLAIARNPEVARREQRARALDAESRVSVADAPTLRISDLRLDRWIDGPARAGFDLRLPIARPGTLAAGADAFAIESDIERARGAIAAAEMARDLRVAWARRTHWHDRAQLAAEEEALLRSAYLRLAEQHKRAQVDALTLAESETALARAEGDSLMTRSEIARWDAVITASTGLAVCHGPTTENDDDATHSDAPRDELERLATANDLVDLAWSRRPEVSALMSERALTEVELAVADRSAWPWFEWVQFGYHLQDSWSSTSWGFALSIELPFSRWDGAARDAARTRGRGVDAQAQRVVEQIRAEVVAAQTELSHRLAALHAIEALLTRQPPKGPGRIDALRSKGHGEVTTNDLVALERDQLRLTRLVLDARLAVAEAHAQLLRVIGQSD